METKKVLIVEDDFDMLVLLQVYLSKLSSQLEVKIANNGYDALELSRNEKFDLLLVDFKMPKMSGEKFMQIYRQELNGKAFAISISGLHPHLLRNFNTKLFDISLTKPFSFSDLKSAIEKSGIL